MTKMTDQDLAERRALLQSIANEPQRLLRTREVAILFQVSERAVTDWARRGRIRTVRTPGGHRRYPTDAVKELLVACGHPIFDG